jgi:hypothetical protein
MRTLRLFHRCWLPVVIATLLACQAQPTQIALPTRIFAKGRRLTYQVIQTTPTGQHPQIDTLVLTSFGPDRRKIIYTFPTAHYTLHAEQINLGYSYNAHTAPNSFAGVFEHDSLLWIHPPREGFYRVLELSPYPYIQLPARLGHQWSWQLEVGDSWSNPLWATWRGLINVQSHYQVLRQQWLTTPLGPLHCWVVRAQTSSPVGSSSLDLWYHPVYGFVRLNYLTVQGKRVNFKLVAATTVPAVEPFQPPTHHLYHLPALTGKSE